MKSEMNNTDVEKQAEQHAVEEGQKFVDVNIVRAKKRRACVDGRYLPNSEDRGSLSRPGGDFGLAIGLLALSEDGTIDLTPEECLDVVYDFVTKDGDYFYMHTDQHTLKMISQNELGENETGCGHEAKAMDKEKAPAYGVDPEKVMHMLAYARTKDKVIEISLPGTHKEIGLIEVFGRENTLNHQDGSLEQNNLRMYFVYDHDRDRDFQREIVENSHVSGLTFENFNAKLEQQTVATVKYLAGEKPWLRTNLDEENPKVTFVMIIPKAA